MSQPCLIFRGKSFYVNRECVDYAIELELSGDFGPREVNALALHEFSYITNDDLELFLLDEDRRVARGSTQ